MRTIYKKKIYRGNVELRSYELRKLQEKNEDVKIYVGDDYMILTPKDLKTKGKIVNTQYSFINSGQTYRLVGFEWKPTIDMDRAPSMGNIMNGFTQEQREKLRSILTKKK